MAEAYAVGGEGGRGARGWGVSDRGAEAMVVVVVDWGRESKA